MRFASGKWSKVYLSNTLMINNLESLCIYYRSQEFKRISIYYRSIALENVSEKLLKIKHINVDNWIPN